MSRFVRLLLVTACATAAAGCGGSATTLQPVPIPAESSTPTRAAPVASTMPVPTPVVPASVSPTPGISGSPIATPGVPHWVAAGRLGLARSSTHAVLLSTGRVLVVGDDNTCVPGGAWDTSVQAELFDAAHDTWSKTGSLNAPRDGFVAVPLPGGRALVTGGVNDQQVAYSSTKIFGSADGQWTSSGLLGTARLSAAGVVLQDGRVLVAGGLYLDASTDRVLDTVEVFDPGNGKWSKTGKLLAPRESGRAVTLADGRVLVAGGSTTSGEPLATAEVWDPKTGKWSGAGTLLTARSSFALVARPDGSALVAGGFRDGQNVTVPLRSAEMWNPASNTWSATAAMQTAAGNRAAAVLADGRVLVAGGTTDRLGGVVAAAEMFDGTAWTPTAPLPAPRTDAVAVRLNDGSVLVVGGDPGLQGEPSTPWCPKPIAAAVRFVP